MMAENLFCFLKKIQVEGQSRKKERENIMEKLFKLKANGTTVRTEILAGLTTFMTMAYIIALNPNLLTNCNDLTVLRVVENLDAVRVVFAVEFRNLLAKRLAEVQRRQCQNGLLRQHGCIHGVECVKTVGPVDAFVLRTEQYLQVAVFGNRNVFKVRGVEVAVEKRDDFCFLLRG